jgi:Mn2+/Fe2+ NRAMP family transporter
LIDYPGRSAASIARRQKSALSLATAILNGLISPPLLFLVVQISSNRSIMGPYANPPLIKLAGWALFAFMTIALIALFVLPG